MSPKIACPMEEFRKIQSHYPQLSSTGCTRSFCQSGRMVHTDECKVGGERTPEAVEAEAVDFLHQLHRDGVIKDEARLEERVSSAIREIRRSSVVVPDDDGAGGVGDGGRVLGGTWYQTSEELEHGLRLSWKHSRKCIMRSEYGYLKLCDLRHVKTSKEMGQAIVEGMCEAFNGGDIQPSVFVFPPKKPNHTGPLVWSQQFLAFAGWRQPDGTILGDPLNAPLTDAILALGWTPPPIRTRWDLLPLVTMADGDEPYITPVPASKFPLVHIRHPDPRHALAFDKLGLRWVPAPALSQLGFDIGGLQYTAASFIGWFMDAEIGVRDLADSFRYDVLPAIVSALGLVDPSRGRELDELPQWERLALLSRAQTELNMAVCWSFLESGVRMSDSLTASAMYTSFDDAHRAKHGFRLPADPYWLSPPQESIVPVWHRGAAPNYQPKPMICRVAANPIRVWKRIKAERERAKAISNGILISSTNGRHSTSSITNGKKPISSCASPVSLSAEGEVPPPAMRVFFCSSGTTAQRLAVKLEQRLRIMVGQSSSSDFSLVVPAAPLNDFDPLAATAGDVILVVASSAGRGDVPVNGRMLVQKCASIKKNDGEEVGVVVVNNKFTTSFCIFGNGNSSYASNYNGAALKIETALTNIGLRPAMPLFAADTLKEDPPWRQFRGWLARVEAAYGDAAEDALADSSAAGAADAGEESSTGSLLAHLWPAKVVSVFAPAGGGQIRRLTLDVGGLEYSHMSHVDIFIPLAEDVVDDLLQAAGLTGDELLAFEEGQISARQLFSLIDPEKPLTSLRWTTSLNLELTTQQQTRFLQNPIKETIRDLPTGWSTHVKRSGLVSFMAALPTRRPRTFSTASSPLYWNLRNMGNLLELTLQVHPGGFVTDRFLTAARRGQRIFVRIRHGPGAHLVTEARPLIAFTTGSGIAPLRGLLQARSAIAAGRSSSSSSSSNITSSKTSIKADATNGAVPYSDADINTGSYSFENNRNDAISLFLGFRPGDTDLIAEASRDALALHLIDLLHSVPSNPERRRAQDGVLRPSVGLRMRDKLLRQQASVFVCASKEAADDFARNLSAVVGVDSIRDVLGERWVEEVYVFTEG